MKYDLEISLQGYETDIVLVYAENLYITDIIEIIKQYPLDSNRFETYYKIIIKERKVIDDGNTKQ